MEKDEDKNSIDEHLGKEHRYRSIAAGKLIEIDSKFGFCRSANSVLDLCAARGGWMQVAVEKMPPGSLIIGVDCNSIRPIDGALSVRESIRLPKCSDVIKKLMAENGCGAFDLVLHDGSTGIGGSWSREAINQNALVFDAVMLATELLAPEGTVGTRVFRSIYCSGILFLVSSLKRLKSINHKIVFKESFMLSV